MSLIIEHAGMQLVAKGTALVTGASRGIGSALCDELIARGWSVLALTRTKSEHEGNQKDQLKFLHADLEKDEAEFEISAQLHSLSSPIDVLVNNAGRGGTRYRLADVDLSEIAQLFQLHVLGALRVTRAAIPFLRQSGSATIINISSRLGSLEHTAAGRFSHLDVSYAYRIAKAAQNMLSISLAQDRSLGGIRILAVHPGRVLTGSGASDASMTPQEAAVRLADMIERRGEFSSGHFYESSGEELEW